MMNKIASNIEDKNVPLEMTEGNMFFAQMLDEIDSDIQQGIGWDHVNEGQNYLQIFSELHEMKSPEEKEAIEAYLNKEVAEA